MSEKPSKQRPLADNEPGSGRKLAVAIVLLVLMLPAAAAAFFISCLATAKLGPDVAYIVSGASAVLTILGITWTIVRVSR